MLLSPGSPFPTAGQCPRVLVSQGAATALGNHKTRNKEINACFMTCPSLPLHVSFLFTPSPGSVTGLPGSEMPFPSIWGSEEGSGHWIQHGSFQSAVWSQQWDAPQGNCRPWRAALPGPPLQHIPYPCSQLHPHHLPGVAVSPRTFPGAEGCRGHPSTAALGFLWPWAGVFVGAGFSWPISVLSACDCFSCSPL